MTATPSAPAGPRGLSSPPPPRHFVTLDLRALMDVGSLPGVAFGVGGAIAIHPGPLRLALGMEGYWNAGAIRLGGLPDARSSLDLLVGTAAACWDFVPSTSLDFAPCASLELGRLRGVTVGVTSPGDASALWIAAGPGARLSWLFAPPFGLVAAVDGLFPFLRPSFVVTGFGEIHRPAPAALRLSAGLELAL
jgi:hypothetical protein